MFEDNKFDNRELMVGDYVLYEGEHTRITQINDCGDCWTEKNHFTENEGVEPIKISKEMLERNGFEPYDEDESLYLFPGDPSLCVKCYHDDDYGFCIGHLIKNSFAPFIFIDYVHELQHILHLFGVTRFGNLSNNFIIC